MTQSSASKPGVFARIRTATVAAMRGLFESLPGQLLMVTVGFALVGLALVYFPAASAFRTQWMLDRAEAAHIAALAADVAPAGSLGEEEMAALLMGANAMHVARVRDGRNELVLYGGPMPGEIVYSDMTKTGWPRRIMETVDALFSPEGRHLRIRAYPRGAPDEIIDVITPEQPLKEALYAFSGRFLSLIILVGVAISALIYIALYNLFVRPMARLSLAITRFQKNPDDPGRVIEPGGGRNEIGRAEVALRDMQIEVRQALRQRERLAALGSAVAKINHDLRNILSSAQLVTDRLAESDDPRVRRMGARLVRSVDRGVRLCEATLQYGRAEETPPERHASPARSLVEDAAADALMSEAALAGATAKWRNEIDEGLQLCVDPDQAHRIFLNLFRNALQAMRTAGTEQAALCARAKAANGRVEIEVCDTGPGVPDKALDRLFEPFVASTSRGGAGLGLSIARELARGHGGDVWLVRTGAEGSVFGVRLPTASGDEGTAPS